MFLIKTPELRGGRDPDPTRVAEGAARAVGIALIPHLANLKKDNLSPLAVRITLDQDNVSSSFIFHVKNRGQYPNQLGAGDCFPAGSEFGPDLK